MKKLKKFLAMMISMVMVLSMATVGFATTGGKVNLTVNLKGANNLEIKEDKNQSHTVKLYKLLNIDSYSLDLDSGDKLSYSLNKIYEQKIKEALGTPDMESSKIIETLSGYTNNSTDIKNFANKFEEICTEAPDANIIIPAGKTSVTTKNPIDEGYYLIVLDNAKEIQATLTNVYAKNNTVDLKEEAPSIEKSADVDDVEIGQIVTYTITTTIPKQLGADMVYKITDTLSDGLDFVNFNEPNAIVTQDNLEIDAKLKDKNTENYTPITEIKASVKGRTMTINLAQYIKDNQAKIGQEIRIQYKAKVNENAVIETNNSATLEYGKNSQSTITNKPVQVKTPTFPVHINKVDDKQAALGGVKFELYTDNGGQKGTAINVSNSMDGIYKVQPNSGTTEMVTVGSDITNAGFGKPSGFNLVINGLKAGTYWLQETQALDGYNKIKEPIKITITNNNNNGSYTIGAESIDPKDEITAVDNIVTIVNKTSSALPETGGTGTLLLTAVGALLVAVAMVRFMRRKQEN